MSEAYWIVEYARVALAYAATFYLWPAVVFGTHLKGKPLSYQFAFCTLGTTAILTTVISFLGLAHLINPILLGVLFYGAFVVRLVIKYNPFAPVPRLLDSVHRGTLSKKRLLLNIGIDLLGRIRKRLDHFWRLSKNRRLRYLTLLVCLVFGSMYFSYNALQLHCYGVSDEYVHHSWVWAMNDGGIYPKGVYPEGLHCVIYALSKLFGIRTYSVMLYLGGVYVHAILIAAYLMMRELFSYEFTPVFVLVAFLTVKLPSADGVSGMTRLASTLPMEFGFMGAFLAAACLLRFIKRTPDPLPTPWYRALLPYQLLHDRDLFVFSAGVAVTIMVHFYATIIAFILCAAISLVFAVRVLRPRRFVPLLTSVLVALVVSTAPMLAALGLGCKFQGSINWAIAVSRGGEEAWASGAYDPNTDYRAAYDEEQEQSQGEGQSWEATLPVGRLAIVVEKIVNNADGLYEASFEELYPEVLGEALMYLTVVVVAVSVVACAVLALWHLMGYLMHRRGDKEDEAFESPLAEGAPSAFARYLCMTAIFVTFMISYDPRPAGLPILISGVRLCALIQLFALMVLFCAPDLVLSLVARLLPLPLMSTASCAGCVALYVLLQGTGLFHGFLYYELTRWPAAVDATEHIINHMPQNMYTIVSTTEEYYQLIGNGYHEELIDLVGKDADPTYTIPTPYVFVFVEKHPLVYAQRLMASGPLWLASDANYATIAQYREDVSIYPNILHGSTSEQLATKRIPKVNAYAEPDEVLVQREILESHGEAWLNAMRSLFPNECQTIYEDDDFACVCIHQNPYTLLTLGVMGEEKGTIPLSSGSGEVT